MSVHPRIVKCKEHLPAEKYDELISKLMEVFKNDALSYTDNQLYTLIVGGETFTDETALEIAIRFDDLEQFMQFRKNLNLSSCRTHYLDLTSNVSLHRAILSNFYNSETDSSPDESYRIYNNYNSSFCSVLNSILENIL